MADLQLQVPQVLIDRGQRSVDADPVAAVTSAPARGVSLTLAAAPAAVAGIVVQALQRAARGAAPLAETSRLRRTMPNLAVRECRGQWVLVLGARLRLPCRLACNLRPPRWTSASAGAWTVTLWCASDSSLASSMTPYLRRQLAKLPTAHCSSSLRRSIRVRCLAEAEFAQLHSAGLVGH